MLAESAPHTATWMAYGAQRSIWGKALLPQVQRDLRTIAITVAQHSSNDTVYVLVRQNELATAQKEFLAHMQEINVSEDLLLKHPHKIQLIPIPNLDDIWMRDTGPVFVVRGEDSLGAINFNFNGWGRKQSHSHDRKVAQFVMDSINHRTSTVDPISSSPPRICHALSTHLVLEGGGIEVDGLGTAILTESCILNPNRNPGLTKAGCETALRSLLGVTKTIWLPGKLDRYDITDGHIDGYVRFAASPTTLLVAQDDDTTTTRKHMEILRYATNAQNQPFRLVPLQNPTALPKEARSHPEFCATYINFYVANGMVLLPQFGDGAADRSAATILQQEFPQHAIRPIPIHGIAAGGGGIHCVTQQQPYVPGV
jgi:agmatine deiminase